MTQHEWDRHFLGLAAYVAKPSRDPSTQTGAVIVDRRRRVVSTGYNGFARGVDDAPSRYADRPTKYRLIIHCEVNAILFAAAPLGGATLYTWPFAPCAACAAVVIQAGITRCVAPALSARLAERWAADLELTRLQFAEAGVTLVELEGVLA